MNLTILCFSKESYYLIACARKSVFLQGFGVCPQKSHGGSSVLEKMFLSSFETAFLFLKCVSRNYSDGFSSLRVLTFL